MADYSPMMLQYFRIKNENPGAILFFRLGDFYEMFYDDAKLVSKKLELTLTDKKCGNNEKAPMCGVPYHSCEAYIARLIAKGYKIAICEQTEDPATAKGLVKRDVVRVITPGTVTESSMLEEGRNNYLASVCRIKNKAGLAFVDTSTGDFHLTTVSGSNIEEKIINELGSFIPKEVIANKSAMTKPVLAFIRDKLGCCFELLDDDKFDVSHANDLIKEHFKVGDVTELAIEPASPALLCAGAALEYLFQTRMTGLENINKISVYSNAEFMRLDLSARMNLELFETMRSKEKKGSLLWVIDKTKTAMGKRLLRSWLEQPLINPAAIRRRLRAVEELHADSMFCYKLGDTLSHIFDIERLITRIVYSSANAPDLLSLALTISYIPELKEKISVAKCAVLREIYDLIDELKDVEEWIDTAINDEAPSIMREGGIIKDGYNKELDMLRKEMAGGSGIIAEIQERERERTGIKNLKVAYNKVFGYYIEITNSFKHLTPDYYITKQTTTNAERYITEELKDLEQRVLGAKERAIRLEHELFTEVRSRVAAQLPRIQTTAAAIARLDALNSLAAVALQRGYCCPEIASDGKIDIREGRHPVVETVIETPFVCNDAYFDMGANRCAIITGPNMAGKSTYMRQVALIVVLAQIGSFVPSSFAHIGIVDAVFTRVGASDDLFAGQSTFMVEMSEVSNILKNATKNSLLILDEIGRGTSTYDGMSIAQAVLEYIVSKKLGAKAMFATHYHEMTALADRIEGVNNFNIAVKKRGDHITFLRRILPGGADRSYGIEVAALAGVPKSVVNRAREILEELESTDPAPQERPHAAKQPEDEMQISLASGVSDQLAERLKALDVETLTPIEALNELYELKKISKSF